MAKRKRASLKDKPPETLGMSRKKNKGMDLLFGGAVEKDEDSLASQPEAGAQAGAAAPADVDPAGLAEGLVDELGVTGSSGVAA